MATITIGFEAFKAGLAAVGVETSADNIFNFMAPMVSLCQEAAQKAEAALKETPVSAEALQEAQEALRKEKKNAVRSKLDSLNFKRAATEWEARAGLAEAEARALKEENVSLKWMLELKDESLWKALALSMTDKRQRLGIMDAQKGAPSREEVQQVTFDVYRLFYGEALTAKGLAEA